MDRKALQNLTITEVFISKQCVAEMCNCFQAMNYASINALQYSVTDVIITV